MSMATERDFFPALSFLSEQLCIFDVSHIRIFFDVPTR